MADLEKLDKTIKELEIQSKDLKEFSKVYTEIGKLKQDISDNLSKLKEINANYSTTSNDIQSRLKKSKEQIDHLEDVLIKQIQELYQDNKNFQKELDGSLLTRLDKHKSDTQLEIRNVGYQIERAFESTLKSYFNAMEVNLKENFSLQSKQISGLKTLIIILMLISLGLAIGLYLK